MFSKFSTILQQAVDVLAPETTPLEDFQYHWKAVTNFYVENTDDKCPVSAKYSFKCLTMIFDMKIHFSR